MRKKLAAMAAALLLAAVACGTEAPGLPGQLQWGSSQPFVGIEAGATAADFAAAAVARRPSVDDSTIWVTVSFRDVADGLVKIEWAWPPDADVGWETFDTILDTSDPVGVEAANDWLWQWNNRAER